MPSVSSKQDRDRYRISDSDAGAVEDFAIQHNLTVGQVMDLIREHGGDRKKLHEAARKLQERF